MDGSTRPTHSHVTRDIRKPGTGCDGCDDYWIGKETTHMGMRAIVKAVRGSYVTYELGTDKIEVTINTKPLPEAKPQSEGGPGTI